MVCHHVYDDAPAAGTRANATLAHPGHVNIGLTYFRASPGALRCADAWLARLLRGYEDSAKIWDQKLFPDAMHHCAGVFCVCVFCVLLLYAVCCARLAPNTHTPKKQTHETKKRKKN